jgi:hypothetical protein
MNSNHSRIVLTTLSTSVEQVEESLETLDEIRRWWKACIYEGTHRVGATRRTRMPLQGPFADVYQEPPPS